MQQTDWTGCAGHADGGVIQRNPSKIGGTWAYIYFDAEGTELSRDSGTVTPAQIGRLVVTNNYTELYAVYRLMAVLPDGWNGTIYTDSQITQRRLTNPTAAFSQVPPDFVHAVKKQCRRLGRYKVILLDGHPTREQLKSGVGKRGSPVSKWNVLVDQMCKDAGLAHLKSLAEALEVKK